MSRRTHSICLLVLLSLPAASAPAAAARRPAPSAEAALAAAAATACPDCRLGALERRLLTENVAEYTLPVRVGPGEHEVIGLHRVVRERAPFVPAPTSRAVLLAHGDIWGFDAAFLSSLETPDVPDGQALPVFLAEHGVDVWGISFRWTRVPADETDLSFMADWGIATDAHDLGVALALARVTRGLTGHGFGRLHLLGWSRGGQIGYAYLDGESRLPPALRQVRGFIPVDIYLKTDVPEFRAAACLRFAFTQAQIDAGEDADPSGQLLAALGVLARTAPDDPSPVIPGLTNRQAALTAGAATFVFFPPGLEFVPFYHFTGGTFDESGVPTSLLYTEEDMLFAFLAGGSPWQPLRELAEADASTCDGPEAPDQPWDDRLAEITVPVLYVGAGGGFGEFGVYTTTLLGSTDVTTLLVDLRPPEERLFDFGHGDLFSAGDAEELAWEGILEWLEGH